MFGKLLPHTIDFYDDFDRLASVLVNGAQELHLLISEKNNPTESANKIASLEKDADVITRHCVQSLHKIFITPFEREDIYKLITQMDDILDIIEDVAARVVMYKLSAMPDALKTMAQVLLSTVQEINLLIHGLRSLKNTDEMHHIFIRIHDYEHESDHLLRSALTNLFANEKDPIALIKWKEIYELIEESVDCCEDVANTVENIIIEQT